MFWSMLSSLTSLFRCVIRISIRGYVCRSVGPSDRRSVRASVRPQLVKPIEMKWFIPKLLNIMNIRIGVGSWDLVCRCKILRPIRTCQKNLPSLSPPLTPLYHPRPLLNHPRPSFTIVILFYYPWPLFTTPNQSLSPSTHFITPNYPSPPFCR